MRKNSRSLTLIVFLGAALAMGIAFWIAPRQHENAMLHASESQLRAVVQKNPRDGIALYYLALARQKAAVPQESEPLLEASLKADPSRPLTWLALATLTESKGDAAHAEKILTEMRDRFPDNAQAHIRLARLLLARDAPTRAYALAKRATALSPQDAEAWIVLSNTCLSTDRLGEARTALEQAARLQPNTWQVAFAQGDLSMTQKSFTEAASHYRRAATLAQGDPLPWLALAHSLVRPSDPTVPELREAETSLQKAAVLEKRVPLYPHVVAKLRMHQKRWREALEFLNAARLRNPADPEIVFDQGTALKALGKTADSVAARTLHRMLVAAQQRQRVVLSELAQNPPASKMRERLRELAHLYQTQGRLWDARRTLEGVMALGEDAAAVRAEIAVLDNDPRMMAQRLTALPETILVAEGNTLLEQNHSVAAQSRFAEVIRRNPANAIALQGVGLSLLQQGRSLQAVPYFTQATELMPDLIASQFYLGEKALDFGLIQEAVSRLEKATRLAPNDPQVWYLYNRALAQMGTRTNDQIAALKKCVTLTPNNPEYRTELAEVLVDAGKFDEAEIVFRGLVAQNPNSAETQARLGGFLVNSRTNGNYAEAAALLNRAHKADPRHAYTRYCLGTLALKQGRAAEAVPLLREAAQASPHLQEPWYLLARAYTAVGKTAEAQEALRRSRQIQQDVEGFKAAQEKLQDDVRDPVQRLKVARLCQKFNQPLKAMAHYRILLSQWPTHPEALREQAALERQFAQTGQTERFAAYEEMLRAGTPAAKKDTK